ncbi:Coiled-coil-helix-coiled-coil-helix domain-containing protein 5, partial [Stegodyphus mimosarum]
MNPMEGKAMQIVNSHCSTLMNNYSKCVDKYPNVWYTACAYHRHELARCSETHPVMLKVKTKCDTLFRRYEKCQKAYPDDHSRCNARFNAFLNCVEYVANDASNS